jgi:NlpC/P60 family protein
VTSRAAAAGSVGLPIAAGVGAVLMPFLVLGAAGGAATPLPGPVLCGGGGTAQTIAGTRLDAEQLGNAHTIITVTANRHLPGYAAIVAVTTAYTESSLHNTTTQTDHDSEGLYQQRISIYTKPVADDPVTATNAFLDRLIHLPHWQTTPVGVDAQQVQASRHPERYQPNAALAERIVGQYWATSAAAAGPAARPGHPAGPSAVPPPICPGGGGAGKIVGPTGNNIAGTTTIPPGLVITGTPQGQTAVRFALQQLGKPYVFAAAGPDAYDCSGLTLAAWATAGIPLPHLAAAQATLGTPEPTNLTKPSAATSPHPRRRRHTPSTRPRRHDHRLLGRARRPPPMAGAGTRDRSPC